MGQSEKSFDFVVWRNCRPGCRLVHGSVLRAVLPADDTQCEWDISELHRSNRFAAGRCRCLFSSGVFQIESAVSGS